MYTIEIILKSHSVFHSGIATFNSAKDLAKKFAAFPGVSEIIVKNDKTGKIEYTVGQ